jgi:hypothetical protein
MDGWHCGDGWGGGGGGWGWIFPAVIIGRLISNLFDRPAPQTAGGWPPVPAPPPAGPAAPPAATHTAANLTCQHCGGLASAAFNFCPHCGHKLALNTCRYCGQSLAPDMRFCGHCGGPRRER